MIKLSQPLYARQVCVLTNQTVLGVSASHHQRLALDHTVAYAVLFHALSYAAKGNITKHLSNKGGDQTVMGSPHPNATPHLGCA